MQLLTFRTASGSHAGVIDGNDVLDLTVAAERAGGGTPTTLLGWCGVPDAVPAIRRLTSSAPRLPLEDIRIVAPLGRPPRNVLCVGANYREHAEESERIVGPLNLPDDPVFFTKDVRALCGPYDELPHDARLSTQMDWEVELGVVIGRGGRDIALDAALDHVFGYTIVNDISFRDVQLGRSQWWMGKSVEGSSPYGPYVTTVDELSDPHDLELRCWVDGELKQKSTTAHMIHGVAALVAELSRFLTLEPGDIVSTGTPAGVGLASDPQQWLVPGSVVEAEITGLGRQRNLVVTRG